MIKIGICDNNKEDRIHLCKYIDIYFSTHSYSYNILLFENSNDLVDYYLNNINQYIDLLFIDVDLPEINGIEVCKKIRSLDSNLCIVFNTLNLSYTLESFQVWPLYYNIKPIEYSEISFIIDRFLRIYNHCKEENLLVKNGKKFINLSYNEITFIESQNTTLKIHMNNYEILKTYGKLDDIEKKLSNKRFLRCHKSFLINMDYVKSVEAYKFTTIFGDSVSIKQRDSSKIKKEYYDYVSQKEKYEKSI